MRQAGRLLSWVLRTLVLAALPLAALPQHAALGQGAGEACNARGRVLGVSRVLEIDTSTGPKFGQQQYKEANILQDGEVVLTFDDGPLRAYTKHVLEALAAHCTKATFFMVGRQAVADPDIVRDIARRGHTVGTHTYTHANLRAMGATQAQQEIELGFSAVQRAAGQPIAPFFRFPYLADSRAMMEHLGQRKIGIFSIDVDSIDYRTQDPNTVHRNVITSLVPKRKGILLFHDIQPSTAGALRRVLDDLAARGFKVVHLVAKAPVVPLPAYVAMAETEMSRRGKALAANPLASRSIVGTMPSPLPKASLEPLRPAPAPVPTAATAPVLAPPAVVIYPPGAEKAAPPLRGGIVDDWQTRVFGH